MTDLPTTPRPGPIFVVGANGSGSTLLRLMLDSHEHIAIPEETGFLRLALAHSHVPYWELGDQWHHHLGLTDGDLDAALRGFYGGLFDRYAASRGKQRWGDKTPFHVWHLELASRLFPDSKVVGIVRHPGAVVTSLRQRFRRSQDQGVQHWTRSVHQLLHAAGSLGDRCVLLRYEDLVQAPEPVMRELLEWLGEPWSASVLSHHEVQPRSGAPRQVEGFTRTDRPIDRGQIDQWERLLHGDRRAEVLGDTRPLAEFLGYDIDRTLPLGEFGDDPTTALLTGAGLERHKHAHGAGIDWAHPPRPAPENLPLRPPAPRPGNAAPVAGTRRSRLIRSLTRWLPPGARRRLQTARRAHPAIDRAVGPR